MEGGSRETSFQVRLLRKSTKVSCLAAKAPMSARRDLFSSCVPVFVERVDQDKDADENVDADQVRTGRPVESGVWIATCSCETSRNFPCSRTREEDRESSSSTSTSSRSATK